MYIVNIDHCVTCSAPLSLPGVSVPLRGCNGLLVPGYQTAEDLSPCHLTHLTHLTLRTSPIISVPVT